MKRNKTVLHSNKLILLFKVFIYFHTAVVCIYLRNLANKRTLKDFEQ